MQVLLFITSLSEVLAIIQILYHHQNRDIMTVYLKYNRHNVFFMRFLLLKTVKIKFFGKCNSTIFGLIFLILW